MSKLIFDKLGITDEQLIDLTEEKAVELITGIKNGFKNEFLDNEDFYKEIREERIPADFKNKYLNEGTAKIAGIAKKQIDKDFSLTDEDKAKFNEDEQKDIAKYISKAKSILAEKLSSGNKNVDELQTENLSLKQKLDEYKNQAKTLNEKFESDLSLKLTNKEIEMLTLMEASKLSENLYGQIGAVHKLVYPTLQSKYTILAENGVVSLRKKDNPEFKVEFDNAGKKEHLTIEKALELEFKSLGFWKEKQEPNPQGKGQATVVVDYNSKPLPKSIKKKIEEEEAFFSKYN